MPLLTFEGVEVDIPTSLAGIQFAFADGSLSIRCSGFSGDIVLSKPHSEDVERSSGSKKRAIDLSASDDDESDSGGRRRPDAAAAKRARLNFLSVVEESMLLAQLDPTSSAASSPQSATATPSEIDSVVSVDSRPPEPKDAATGSSKTKAEPEENKTFSSTAASVMSAFLRGGKDAVLAATNSKKTTQSSLLPPTKKNQKPARKTQQGGDATAASSIVSPEPKPPTSRSATPESNQKKRGRPKKKLEDSKSPASSQPTKPTTSKLPAATARWDTVTPTAPANTTATSSTPSPPVGRWGHTATPISEDRIVVYGGADDDERTLGDLHVFDLSTRSWSRPLNCESLPRTWHDAVYLDSKHLLLVFGGERLVDSGSAGASGGDNGEDASAGAADGHMDILSDIMVLDTECFLWYPPAIRGSPPSARSGHSCTVLGNDVVVFGGSRGRNRQSSVHVLDSDEWMWRSIAIDGKPPSARTYHSAVAIGDNRIVYFGGNDSTKCFNSVHVLEKSSSLSAKKKRRGGKKSNDSDKDEHDSSPTTSWSWFHPCVVGDPPRARTGHTATLVDEHKVLVVGGWDPQSDAGGATVVFNDAFLLDTATWEWQRVPVEAATSDAVATAGHEDADAFSWVFPGRVGHRAVLNKRSGRVLLFGGQNARDDRLDTIHALSLSFGAQAPSSSAASSSAASSSAASSSMPAPSTGAPPTIAGGIAL